MPRLDCAAAALVAALRAELGADRRPAGAALILVGSLMLINIVKVKWGNVNEAVPAFLTIIIMPMTYSIAYGAGCFHP